MSEVKPTRLDPLDQEILKLIPDRLTFQEMAEQLNRPARSGIYRRVQKLVSAGLVTKDERKSRSRKLTDAGQRLLGQILNS